jgi:hypothetical protein
MKSKLMVRGTLGGVFVIMLSLVLIISALPVQAIPQPGHHFYGNVTGAALGDVISAQIYGVEYATTTVDAQGRYGYETPFVVPSDDRGTRRVKEGGERGDTVEFYILGELAGEAPFAVWGLTCLDLSLFDDVELEVTSGGNGSTDPSGTTTCAYGEVVSVTATADSCYELDYWEVNGVINGSDNPLSIAMDGDYSVTAYFAKAEYDLTLGSGSDGDITSPAEGTHTYPCDTMVSVTATADSGYELNYWEINGVVSGNDNPLSITMGEDYNVEANFALIDTGGDDGTGDDNNNQDLPSLGGNLVAFVFIPDSQEDFESVLAILNAYLNEDIQTYYRYIPGESGGSGYWEPMP